MNKKQILKEFYNLYDSRDIFIFYRLKQWKTLIFGIISKCIYTFFNESKNYVIIKIPCSKEIKYIQRFVPV